MQPREGESALEQQARRRVLDSIHELFKLARESVPAAIKRAASDKPQRENAAVTDLNNFQRRQEAS